MCVPVWKAQPSLGADRRWWETGTCVLPSVLVSGRHPTLLPFFQIGTSPCRGHFHGASGANAGLWGTSPKGQSASCSGLLKTKAGPSDGHFRTIVRNLGQLRVLCIAEVQSLCKGGTRGPCRDVSTGPWNGLSPAWTLDGLVRDTSLATQVLRESLNVISPAHSAV